MRVLVYGDSNSWGYPTDDSGVAYARPWPQVMAEALDVELIQAALPGRTTCHDDPGMEGAEPSGATWNGLRHLEATLFSASPVDWLLIMLGTNDMKARFQPTAGRIADGIMQLADLAGKIPAGPGGWDDEAPPAIGLIVPPPLPEFADDPGWDREAEWTGGRAASLALFSEVRDRAARSGLPVFDAGQVASGSQNDPIHFDATTHEALGRAVAAWLRPQLSKSRSL